jgi:hypothetical protein
VLVRCGFQRVRGIRFTLPFRKTITIATMGNGVPDGCRSFTLLRRAGTHEDVSIPMDPGSAARRYSALKTRVNALMTLRGIRGTP